MMIAGQLEGSRARATAALASPKEKKALESIRYCLESLQVCLGGHLKYPTKSLIASVIARGSGEA